MSDAAQGADTAHGSVRSCAYATVAVMDWTPPPKPIGRALEIAGVPRIPQRPELVDLDAKVPMASTVLIRSESAIFLLRCPPAAGCS